MLTAAELAAMRSIQNDFMPGTAVIQRATLTPDGTGGYSESWQAVGTVRVRLYPQNSRAMAETVAGAQVLSVTRWFVTMPTGTEVSASDRLLIDNRTFEILEVNNGEMYQTAVRCEVTAHNEESRA